MSHRTLAFAALLLVTGCADQAQESAGSAEAPVVAAQAAAVDAPQAPVADGQGGVVGAPAVGEWKAFGSAMTLTDVVNVKTVLAEPAPYIGKEILVEGTIVDVCQKAGCWMVMSDGSQEIRVLMKEHGFSVDKDGAGALARVQGTLEAVEVSPDEVAHLEGESARADLMPEKKGMKYRLIATGAAFLGKPAPTEG
jgi:hypothetical protein